MANADNSTTVLPSLSGGVMGTTVNQSPSALPSQRLRAREQVMPGTYPSIADHGVIGDLRTVALVSTGGTIDWYCPGRFDAPSVFGSLLDWQRGGYFRIAPCHEEFASKQLYLPETNVLITRFLSADGVAEVHDFMPIGSEPQMLVRRIVGVRGSVPMRIAVEPRFDYGRARHQIERQGQNVSFQSDDRALSLSASIDLSTTREGGVTAQFIVAADTNYSLVLSEGYETRPLTEAEVQDLMTETVHFWQSWLRQSRYAGRWREMVDRSALTLKLLTYAPTGATVAAATTSLPEFIGGGRNWDYRFAWTRDFAFSTFALSRLGFTEDAKALARFLQRAAGGGCVVPEVNGPLHVLYGIDPASTTNEEILDHWEGYRGSGPVRIGNAAERQLQLDIYGDFLDAIYLSEQSGSEHLMGYDEWTEIARVIDWLCDHWDEPDDGIWEVRNGRQRWTFSRLMSWVAIDRAIRIADHRGFPADRDRWSGERNALFKWIMSRGWNESRGAFVQSEASDELDASLLLMPLVHFLGPTDPRWLSTLEAIGQELVSDSLVFRYDHSSADGLEGPEGTFSMCTFWYVECLARAGRVNEARLIFEKMLTYANHVGLYSEQIGSTGELLGNFPQAFTHLALISAAITLDRRLASR
jgi:GH15 family glucan-1,4-alpha-glucosidase